MKYILKYGNISLASRLLKYVNGFFGHIDLREMSHSFTNRIDLKKELLTFLKVNSGFHFFLKRFVSDWIPHQ